MKTKLLLAFPFCFCLISNTQAQTLPTYLPADGLVGWWPFNGNANDESGNGNDGTVNGSVPYISDRNNNISSAIQGGSGYITCPSTVFQFNRDQTFTVSIWFTTEVNSNGGRLLSNESSGVYYGNFRIASIGNGELVVAYGDYINDSLTTSVWHHYVYTYNNRSEKLFVDGTLKYTNYDNDNGVLSYNSPFTIGAKASPSFDTWNGKIDDIAIYNRALSQEEITALYTGEPVSPPTACNPLPSNLQNGLVGYWPFCGNANDESGNGNDGTVNGAILTEDRFGLANAAYNFDGVDDWIQVQNDSTLNLSGDLSISSWLNADSYDLISMIVSKHSPLCDNNLGTFVYGIWDDGGVGNFKTNFSASPIFAAETYPNNNASVSENNWYNFIATYSNNLQVLKYYLNGDLVDTINIDFDITTNPFDLYIGKQDCSNTWHFDGTLDDIGIWNRALTAEEVQQLYTLNACTFSIYDTTYVTIYDTVSVSTTDTLIINTLITNVQPALENTFLVYPNPAGSQITINNGNVSILGGYTMRISNSIGQEVYNQNITQTEVTLDLSNWGGNGLYVLYILDPQGEIIAVKQIVLQ